jgi:hypothetical protein
VSRSARKQAGHFGLDYGQLACIASYLDIASTSGLELKVADNAIRVSEAFSTNAAATKATWQQSLRIPGRSIEKDERLEAIRMSLAPIQDQTQHPPFVVKRGGRKTSVLAALTKKMGDSTKC